ncbi:hypothetical protein CB1_000637008 [Camelus ferus]|nr:hypothetical protein CB1_000637008 [Camelus ferus]
MHGNTKTETDCVSFSVTALMIINQTCASREGDGGAGQSTSVILNIAIALQCPGLVPSVEHWVSRPTEEGQWSVLVAVLGPVGFPTSHSGAGRWPVVCGAEQSTRDAGKSGGFTTPGEAHRCWSISVLGSTFCSGIALSVLVLRQTVIWCQLVLILCRLSKLEKQQQRKEKTRAKGPSESSKERAAPHKEDRSASSGAEGDVSSEREP